MEEGARRLEDSAFSRIDELTGDILTTEMPTPEERARWQRVIPIMNERLQEKGLVKVAESKILVTRLKGPLEEGWQNRVQAFASQIPSRAEQ
jgi:hypothetical protein